MEKYFEAIEKKVNKLFIKESSGHDIYHLKRTFNLAIKIQKEEGGDKLVIGAAALLHDIHRQEQWKTGKFMAPKESLPEIEKILNEVSFPKDKVKAVLHAIEFHEEYVFGEKGKTTNNLETLILQDADNLDAIGAIGIARAFTFGGAHQKMMWNPEIPFYQHKEYDESKLDESEIHHIHNKLLRLKENMNTKTAKIMAIKRTEFMRMYLDHFLKEWEGKL